MYQFPTKCTDCNISLFLKVQQSAAGHYIGRFCPNCGPYSRESEEYYRTREEAQIALDNKTYTQRQHP